MLLISTFALLAHFAYLWWNIFVQTFVVCKKPIFKTVIFVALLIKEPWEMLNVCATQLYIVVGFYILSASCRQVSIVPDLEMNNVIKTFVRRLWLISLFFLSHLIMIMRMFSLGRKCISYVTVWYVTMIFHYYIYIFKYITVTLILGVLFCFFLFNRPSATILALCIRFYLNDFCIITWNPNWTAALNFLFI